MGTRAIGHAIGKLLWLALAAGALLAVPGGASHPGEGRVILEYARPFTDSLAAMAARDEQYRRAIALGLMPPAPGLRRLHPEVPKEVPADGGEIFAPPRRVGPLEVGTGFPGVSLQDQVALLRGFALPPDTMGAIGPAHFVQPLNGTVAVFNRAGTPLSVVSLESFFTITAGSTTYPRGGATDPRVVYDHRSRRWILCCIELNNRAIPSNNHLMLAVSRTEDPTKPFDKYVIPIGVADSGAMAFLNDYPTLGVDDNGVYVGVQLVEVTNGVRTPKYARIVTIPKQGLLANPPFLGRVLIFDQLFDLLTPQPAVNFDPVPATGAAWFVSSNARRFEDLYYRTITWSGGIPTISSSDAFLKTPGYVGSITSAPGGGTNIPINVVDDRMMMAVIRNNQLWCTRHVGVSATGGISGADRLAAEWFSLDIARTTPTLLQQGRVYDTAASDPRYYYFPSLMVNGVGHAALAFAGSKRSEFVGAWACLRSVTDPPNTMGAPTLVKAGESVYDRSSEGVPSSRWGDYSYTSLDPLDDMTFWTVQEYAAAGGHNWGTWITTITSPPPAFTNAANAVVVGTTGATVTLRGTGFFDPGPNFSRRMRVSIGGDGLTLHGVTVHDATRVTVALDVAANATPGSRDITLTNPDGQSVTAAGAFRVLLEPEKPIAPSELTARAVSEARIDLSWKDNSADETGFKVLRKVGTGSLAQVGTTAPGITNFGDTTGLTRGTTYDYTVVATGAGQDSEPSNQASAAAPGGKLGTLAKKLTFPPARFRVPVQPVTRSVTIKNTHATQTMRLTVNEPAAPFAVTGGGGTTILPPGGSQVVTLSFTPVKKGKASGRLTLTTSDPAKSTASITLSSRAK